MRVEGEARSQPHTQMSVRPLALWHSRSLGECVCAACERAFGGRGSVLATWPPVQGASDGVGTLAWQLEARPRAHVPTWVKAGLRNTGAVVALRCEEHRT